MANNSYVQVPPDSTGKKLYALEHSISGVPTQVPCHHVSCSIDPSHIQIVDERGQAYTRSAEGSPTVDAWANARVGEQKAVGVYDFSVNGMDDLFSDILVGAGNVAHNQNKRCITLSVDSANGSSAKRITNRYHYCQPGVGINAVFAIMSGDTGKAGNIRRFGYGDDRNGLFFSLVNGGLQITSRSDATGSVVDTYILQADWNGDKFDGTGISGYTLEPDKINLMFIDLSWVGTGIARFGAITEDGSRWVCHTYNNVGTSVFPFLTNGSLPLYFETTNTTATASTSEFFIYGANVYASSRTDYTFWRFVSDSGNPRSVTTNTPLLSLKCKDTLSNGAHNHVGLYPEELSVYVSGGSIYLKILDDATLTGANWVDDHDSTSLVDRTSTALTDGALFKGVYLGAGSHTLDLSKIYELNDEGYHILSDDSGSYTMTIAATKMDGTTVNVACSLNFRELR